jgi:hypothetical protein
MHEQPDDFIDEARLSEQKPSSAWQLPVMQEGKKSNIEIAGRLDKTVVQYERWRCFRRGPRLSGKQQLHRVRSRR